MSESAKVSEHCLSVTMSCCFFSLSPNLSSNDTLDFVFLLFLRLAAHILTKRVKRKTMKQAIQSDFLGLHISNFLPHKAFAVRILIFNFEPALFITS